MKFLKRVFGKEGAAVTDARRIYAALMTQSRCPEFYGEGQFADDYDGRIDVLTLHIAAILSNLNKFDQNGERLGQALFDEMKDDFEIALREEALSDASVKKQIQPMISLFYDHVKKYAEALHHEDPQTSLKGAFSETLKRHGGDDAAYAPDIAGYLLAFDKGLSDLTLGQIAMTEFGFPDIPSLN